jgi:hypothetical protein
VINRAGLVEEIGAVREHAVAVVRTRWLVRRVRESWQRFQTAVQDTHLGQYSRGVLLEMFRQDVQVRIEFARLRELDVVRDPHTDRTSSSR